MTALPHPDCFYFNASTGWLELGQAEEALSEFKHLSPEVQNRSDVLDLRWLIWGSLADWDQAFEAAQLRRDLFPGDVSTWIQLAYATRRKKGGGLDQARSILVSAMERFPDEEIVAYNLSCYATQLGHLEEAWTWFERAMTVSGSPKSIKERALQDTDLEPLWDRIML